MKKTGFYLGALLIFLAHDAGGQNEDVSKPETITVAGVVFENSGFNGVYDGEDVPSKAAKVVLVRYPASKALAETTTNKVGQFKFTLVGAGDYQFLVTFPSDLKMLSKSFRVDPKRGDQFFALSMPDQTSPLRFVSLRKVNPASFLAYQRNPAYQKKEGGKEERKPAQNVSPFAP